MTDPDDQDPPDDLIATCMDPWGRTVHLHQKQWDHIQKRHPEIKHIQDVQRAVETAKERTRGNRPTTEKLWARNVGPAKWFTVVVAYEARSGVIRTAIPSTPGPKGDKI